MKPDLTLVHALTEAVLPAGIAVAATDPTTHYETPFDVEARAVARAVPARQVEFLAGRAAVHRAMAALSLAQQPVLMGEDRAPVWPAGVTGSISHTRWACVAAVARTRDWAGVGIDLEPAEPLPADLIAQICTTSELAWLDTQPQEQRGLMARTIFSAKEAAYKAQYALSRTLFGFETLELLTDRDTSRFRAVFQTDQPPFLAGHTLEGAYAHAAGVLVTSVAIGHAESTVQAGEET